MFGLFGRTLSLGNAIALLSMAVGIQAHAQHSSAVPWASRWHVSIVTGVRIIAPQSSITTSEAAYLDLRANGTYSLWRPERGLDSIIIRQLGMGRWRAEPTANEREIGLCLEPTGSGAICGFAYTFPLPAGNWTLTWMVRGNIALSGCQADSKTSEELAFDISTPCYSALQVAKRRQQRHDVQAAADRQRNQLRRCDSVRLLAQSPLVLDFDAMTIFNLPPPYPVELRSRGVGGWVVAIFVVNPSGSVDISSMRTDSASNLAFASAVQQVLPTYKFDPVRIENCAVKRTVHLRFKFSP